MAIHRKGVWDGAFSAAVASGLSGAPTDATSTDYSTLVNDAVALATDIDTQVYNLTLSTTTSGSPSNYLMFAIVMAYFKNRNIENAGASPDWDKPALAIATIYVNANAQLQ
jgi:hypothetical protein